MSLLWRHVLLLCVCLLILHNLLNITSGVGGVMVSIAAFQAVDLGSIPGQRTFFFILLFFSSTNFLGHYNRKSEYRKTTSK